MNNPRRIQFTNGRSARRDACQSKNVTKYVYSATGEKLRTIYQTAVPNITVAAGTVHELTDAEILYTDSVDYYHGGKLTVKNGRLDKYYFDGGYAQATMDESNQSDDFAFFYYTADHLGNIREVIDEKGDVVQITNYYPFGTPYSAEDCTTHNPDQQNHKYNGKEFDSTHGLNTYDYGARQYNSLVGRWDRIDPLCEKYYSVSPYAYCANNPVLLIDEGGKEIYLSGTRAERLAVLAQMQQLTNDKLGVNRSTGKVIIMARGTKNQDRDLSVGTNLISDLVNEKHIMTIVNDGEFHNHDNRRMDAKNGKGSDVLVGVNLSEKDKTFTTKNSETGIVQEEQINTAIAIGHELIHGYRAMKGMAKGDEKAKNTWIDSKGDKYIQTVRAEELETTGLMGNCKYSENKLREEQGLNIRIKY